MENVSDLNTIKQGSIKKVSLGFMCVVAWNVNLKEFTGYFSTNRGFYKSRINS